MANPIKINPPLFSKLDAKHRGLKDLEKFLTARLDTDMKQYSAFVQKQITADSETYCYYHERVQLLRKFIAETKELKQRHNRLSI